MFNPLNFFKKKKKPAMPEAASKDTSLENVEFYVMPEKFKGGKGSVSGGGAPKSKKMGLLIIIVGAVVVIAAGALLAFYIFSIPKEDDRPVVIDQPTEDNGQPENGQDNEDDTDEGLPDDDGQDDNSDILKNCGMIISLAQGEGSADYEEEGLVCLGDRIADDCQKTKAVIKTANLGNAEFEILGPEDSQCLAQITYPFSAQISNEEFKDYANTNIQCGYYVGVLNNMGYEDGELAGYVYFQSSLDNLTEDTTCTGTAVVLWKAKMAQGDEEIKFTNGVDSDSDGLTDAEEFNVYVSDANSADTDGDGYKDGDEVLAMYNPVGSGLLKDSGLVNEYINGKYNYSVFYPKLWRLEDKTDGDLIQFYSDLDGFAQILAEDNPSQKGIKDWYADLVDTPASDITQRVQTSKSGLEIIYSADGLAAYISSGGDKVYILSYSPEQGSSLEFMATFEMMVNSFKVQ